MLMVNEFDNFKRIVFVVVFLIGFELKVVKRDVSNVFNILIDLFLGNCDFNKFVIIIDCFKNDFELKILVVLEFWNLFD